MNQTTNQIKYRQIKAMNLTIDQWNHGQKKMLQECIRHKMNENLLLLKDLLEP